MIRLGKDKTLDNYFIDENGVITDQFGNQQKTIIKKDRVYFHSQAVHRIMMYTFYGWRDGEIWAIHHLDENKQNNTLSNLVYLTHSEHNRYHMKGKKYFLGKNHSKETRRRISLAHEGMKNPMAGKPGTFLGNHHSKESKQKLSEKAKLFHWYNDGIKNYRCKECPKGCVKGRIGWHEKVQTSQKSSGSLYK